MFIAYCYLGRGFQSFRRGAEHETRELAAAELFAKYPKVPSVTTANAIDGNPRGYSRLHSRIDRLIDDNRSDYTPIAIIDEAHNK